MTEIEGDAPLVIRWSPGAKPGLVPFGECNHECKHSSIQVVGRGPDSMRSMLVRCTDRTGCMANPSIQCRAWYTERNTPWTKWLAVWIGVDR